MAQAHGSLSHLLPPDCSRVVAAWLREDCPAYDYGGFVVGVHEAEATLYAKESGVLAGVPFFDEVFHQLNCVVQWHQQEGALLPPGQRTPVATVRGSVRHILLGERVGLNILARCSGIATKASQLLGLVRGLGFRNVLSGTRKTTPGFRLVEKYGILVGGCDAHRMDLSAMTMLKDNHIAAAGSISKAVVAAKAVGGFSVKVEVECQSEKEANEAIEAGADIVMLDNLDGPSVGEIASRLKRTWSGQRHFLLEVSGGLNRANIKEYLWNDVDIISTSSIHQGVPHVDFSLKITRSSTAS